MNLLIFTLFTSASAGHVLFRQEGDLYNAKQIIHLSINISFESVLNQCETFRIALRQISPLLPFTGSDRIMWLNAAYWLRSECDFDHIWPAESTRSKQQSTRKKRQVILAPLVVFNTAMGIANRVSIERLSHRLDRA